MAFVTPNKQTTIWMQTMLVAEGFDLSGDPVMYEGDELMGRVLQHEIDHLFGLLLLSHLGSRTKRQALKELREESLDAQRGM